MKFISWNVNGLRACVTKGFQDFFDQADADFFCLQETKLQEGQIDLPLPGYSQFWNYAQKKGYSGTAIFAKQEPLSVTYGVGVEELDTEGRLITLEYEDFYLVTCYTPNAQQGLARIDHRLKWDEAFRNHLCRLNEKKPVLPAIGEMPVFPMKNGKASANFWMPVLPIPSVISSPMPPVSIVGGVTVLMPVRTTPDGALTISWFPTGWQTKSPPPPYTRISLVLTIVL